MGIPGFFKWLTDRDHYPNIARDCIEYEPYYDDHGVYQTINAIHPNPNGIEFDNLYIDMNGLIHSSTKSTNYFEPKTENGIIQSVFDCIDRIFSIVRPRQLLYMAIDGVAPNAKLDQQRSSRFRAIQGAVEKAEEIERIKSKIHENGNFFPDNPSQNEPFDGNCITPGTSFMIHLTDCLRYYIHSRMNTNPAWSSLKVILSGANIPGEGEHKIIDYIRQQRTQPNYNPSTRHVLVGNDADLIILGLALHEHCLTIMRDGFDPRKPRLCEICQQIGHDWNQCQGISKEKFDQSRSLPSSAVDQIKNYYIFVELALLRDQLYDTLMNDNPSLFSWDFERFVDDWVFICLLNGNDFLPNLPSTEIYENSIDDLLFIYLQLVPECNDYLTNNGQLNLKLFKRILTTFGNSEDENFKKWHQKSQLWLNNNQPVKTQIKSSINLNEVKTQNQTPMLPLFKPPAFRLPSNSSMKKPSEVVTDLSNSQQTKGGVTDSVASNQAEEHHDDHVRLWQEGWYERYYTDKFKVNKDQLNECHLQVVEHYIRGLCWVLQYYYEGVPSWDWYYPYHYAPFASDFECLNDMSIHFDPTSRPCPPLEQLISVLPPQSAKYLPETWQSLILKEDSPIHDFYPTKFSVDSNGKRYKSQHTVLLPFVDEKRLREVLADKYSLLTLEERKRNEVEHDLLFIHSQTPTYISLRPSLEVNHGRQMFTHDNPLDVSEVIGVPGCIWRGGNDDQVRLIEKSIKAPMPNFRDVTNNQVMYVKYRRRTASP